VDELEIVGGMGVGVYSELDAEFDGLAGELGREVEAGGVGVDFEGDVVVAAVDEDGHPVEFEAGAGVDEAAGGVAQDFDLGKREGAEYTVGHGGFGLVEGRVDRGDDVIQMLGSRLRDGQIAIGADVDFEGDEYFGCSFFHGLFTWFGLEFEDRL